MSTTRNIVAVLEERIRVLRIGLTRIAQNECENHRQEAFATLERDLLRAAAEPEAKDEVVEAREAYKKALDDCSSASELNANSRLFALRVAAKDLDDAIERRRMSLESALRGPCPCCGDVEPLV